MRDECVRRRARQEPVDGIGQRLRGKTGREGALEQRLLVLDELARVGRFLGPHGHGDVPHDPQALLPGLVDDREIVVSRDAAMNLDEVHAGLLQRAHDAPRLLRASGHELVAVEALAVEHRTRAHDARPRPDSGADLRPPAIDLTQVTPHVPNAGHAESVTVVDGMTVAMEAATIALGAALLSRAVLRFRSAGMASAVS